MVGQVAQLVVRHRAADPTTLVWLDLRSPEKHPHWQRIYSCSNFYLSKNLNNIINKLLLKCQVFI